MKLKIGHSARIGIVIFSAIIMIVFFVYILFIVPKISNVNSAKLDDVENRKYHVAIVGQSENESFLQQIFIGAKKTSEVYDAVVELYVPESAAENMNLQVLLENASFSNPDGIIAYVGDKEKIEVPVDMTGKAIPLITVGQYHSDIPQVSFIGTNYSELGRKIATESNAYLNGNGVLKIINDNASSNTNYSTLMNSLINSLEEYSNITTIISDDELVTGNSVSKEKIGNETKRNLYVCLTEEDTIKVAQMISEKKQNVGIIGFGENEMLDMYLKKNVITELLSIDSQNIGVTAMSELFEYIKYGYANNYINADVRVKKASNND